MKRLALVLLLLVAAPRFLSAGDVNREIGYVESFDKKPEIYVLHHGGLSLPIVVMTPICSGDWIEVRDPTAKIVLRLVNHDTPVTVSQGNLDTPLTDAPPARPFWTPSIAWVASQIGKLDRDDREQVAASVRGGVRDEPVPILALAQTLPAGRQSLAIGWIGSSPADIQLQGSDNKDLASGRGTGGLWLSPQLDLTPGDFVIDVTIGATHTRQLLTVVTAAAIPDLPPDLLRDDIPKPLREVGIAAWLAARDQRFMLAALQHVGPLAPASRPAKLLTRALVRGERPLPPS
jgi:hypothetical protein